MITIDVEKAATYTHILRLCAFLRSMKGSSIILMDKEIWYIVATKRQPIQMFDIVAIASKIYYGVLFGYVRLGS